MSDYGIVEEIKFNSRESSF